MHKARGFTLLEILIALFIFTILSMILVSALHHVIHLQSNTEAKADRLRKLQMALLMMSRDIEQTVDRSIINASGNKEAAFVGASRDFLFTHAGFANPTSTSTQSILRRERYVWDDHSLWRITWDALDQAPGAQSHARQLLSDVTAVHFQYLDKDGQFHDYWPIEGRTEQSLPRAVRVSFTILTWGSLSQLYVIPAQQSKIIPAGKS